LRDVQNLHLAGHHRFRVNVKPISVLVEYFDCGIGALYQTRAKILDARVGQVQDHLRIVGLIEQELLGLKAVLCPSG
jgi:hypothetical protein